METWHGGQTVWKRAERGEPLSPQALYSQGLLLALATLGQPLDGTGQLQGLIFTHVLFKKILTCSEHSGTVPKAPDMGRAKGCPFQANEKELKVPEGSRSFPRDHSAT